MATQKSPPPPACDPPRAAPLRHTLSQQYVDVLRTSPNLGIGLGIGLGVFAAGYIITAFIGYIRCQERVALQRDNKEVKKIKSWDAPLDAFGDHCFWSFWSKNNYERVIQQNLRFLYMIKLKKGLPEASDPVVEKMATQFESGFIAKLRRALTCLFSVFEYLPCCLPPLPQIQAVLCWLVRLRSSTWVLRQAVATISRIEGEPNVGDYCPPEKATYCEAVCAPCLCVFNRAGCLLRARDSHTHTHTCARAQR